MRTEGAVLLREEATPATPPAGLVALYAKADGKVYVKDPAGTETDITSGGGAQAPWRGKLHTLWGDGNPNQQDVNWAFQNTVVSVAAPTQTGIGITVGRLVSFRFEQAITPAHLRYFGLAAVATGYSAAIYNATTGARVWTVTALPIAVGWNALAISGVALAADTKYWFGISATVAGTTAALRTPAAPIASSLGLAAIPGNLAAYATAFAQVTLVAGAWPTTMPALADAAFASAGATGTLPIIFADAA